MERTPYGWSVRAFFSFVFWKISYRWMRKYHRSSLSSFFEFSVLVEVMPLLQRTFEVDKPGWADMIRRCRNFVHIYQAREESRSTHITTPGASFGKFCLQVAFSYFSIRKLGRHSLASDSSSGTQHDSDSLYLYPSLWVLVGRRKWEATWWHCGFLFEVLFRSVALHFLIGLHFLHFGVYNLIQFGGRVEKESSDTKAYSGPSMFFLGNQMTVIESPKFSFWCLWAGKRRKKGPCPSGWILLGGSRHMSLRAMFFGFKKGGGEECEGGTRSREDGLLYTPAGGTIQRRSAGETTYRWVVQFLS